MSNRGYEEPRRSQRRGCRSAFRGRGVGSNMGSRFAPAGEESEVNQEQVAQDIANAANGAHAVNRQIDAANQSVPPLPVPDNLVQELLGYLQNLDTAVSTMGLQLNNMRTQANQSQQMLMTTVQANRMQLEREFNQRIDSIREASVPAQEQLNAQRASTSRDSANDSPPSSQLNPLAASFPYSNEARNEVPNANAQVLNASMQTLFNAQRAPAQYNSNPTHGDTVIQNQIINNPSSTAAATSNQVQAVPTNNANNSSKGLACHCPACHGCDPTNDIDEYEGNAMMSLDRWVSRVRFMQQMHGWSPEETFLRAARRVRKDALDHLTMGGPLTFGVHTFDDLAHALRGLAAEEATGPEAMIELMSIVRQKNEQVVPFFNRVRQCGYRAHAPDNVLLGVTLNGLDEDYHADAIKWIRLHDNLPAPFNLIHGFNKFLSDQEKVVNAINRKRLEMLRRPAIIRTPLMVKPSQRSTTSTISSPSGSGQRTFICSVHGENI